MDNNTLEVSPYDLLFKALSFIPIHHYLLYLLLTLFFFLYNFLEIHFFDYLLTGFRGDPVLLTCNFSSELYQSVASKCPIIHGRFSPTPWLCSPHLQTAFLSLFGNSPSFAYTRHIFKAKDGGTLALDWLMCSDVEGVSDKNDSILQDDRTPILIVIPGLTSDSASASDCFYNAGWTEDIRSIIDHIHCQYPEAPLYAVGTSIGANILSDCFYNAGWTEDIRSIIDHIHCQYPEAPLYAVGTSIGANILSCSVRDFDRHATRVLAKFETVDAYYRRSSCVNFIGNVSLPLLCVSALDDPVCTREAIPWDECRWVRVVDEFFHVLHSSPLRNRKEKVEECSSTSVPQSSIDQGPFLNVMEGGMVTAMGNITDSVVEETCNGDGDHVKKGEETISDRERSDNMTDKIPPIINDKQQSDQNLNDLIVPMRRYMGQLSKRSGISIWLLVYIAIVTTWPLAGSALLLFIKKRFKSIIPAALLRR
ncbi:hypothetical protein JCGZ_00223 [Jatropha curcas]|uniref:Uncharacterized protein n=1 Tax=Jatropha curcas TaxID=180498 RepID=A0A067L1T0_JATCU|nr:hypothetical protein JCGZ_00223 [Jatropha curcas]